MNRPTWLLPAGIGVLMILLTVTAINLAGALGRVSVLREQIEDWQDSTAVAHEATEAAVADFDAVVEEAAVEEAEAVVAIAEATAAVVVQEAEAEASFRRAEALAADNPVLERAIQEMRAEAIVTSMAHEVQEAESAAALFEAQQRIRTLTMAALTERDAHERELATVNTSLSLAMQAINELENAIVPGFFRNMIQNAELAGISAAVGATLAFVVTR